MVPRWSSLARSGAPGPGGIWPFDPELGQLERGLRRAIKRETRGDHEAVVAVAWFRQHGLQVEQQGSVVFASREPALLPRVRELELAGDRDSAAVRELGGLLGYPSCCVERYLSLAIRDDAALFDALLPREGEAAPAESLWLVGALALIAHAPCGLRCARSLELGRATLAVLDERHAGFAARWRWLAARLHQLDEQGRVFAGSEEILVEPLPRVVPGAPPEPARVRWRADHRG